MKTKTISLLTLVLTSAISAETITVGIPDFVNMTADHVTRIAPGKYKEENVKVGEDQRTERFEEDGKSVSTQSSRDVYEKQLERVVEYAPGDWALPQKAGTIAADTLSGKLLSSPNIKVLSRNTQTIKTREEERLFAAVSNSNQELLDLYRDLKADFVVIGRISSFRVDEIAGNAYGVTLKRNETKVSGDIQIVDVATGEVAAQTPFEETVIRNLPNNLNNTKVLAWEEPLRIAIGRIAPSLVDQLVVDDSSQAAVTGEVVVEVTSTPNGADILVGDLFVGNTPAKVSLSEGRSDIRIEKQGYQPWARQVKVHKELKINVTLNETPKAPIIKESETE